MQSTFDIRKNPETSKEYLDPPQRGNLCKEEIIVFMKEEKGRIKKWLASTLALSRRSSRSRGRFSSVYVSMMIDRSRSHRAEVVGLTP